MATYRNVKRQIRLDSEDNGSYICGSKQLAEDWDFARDGLYINWRGARRLSQLYSRVGGIGGRRKKMDWYSSLNVSNGGTSERKRKNSTPRKFDADFENDREIGGDKNPTTRESEVVSSEERVVTVGSQQIEGKPLLLLQVNCRSILNKILEFWNLVDTYNLDVIMAYRGN